MSEHVPVLVTEVLEYLAPTPNDRLLDMTVGLGGHAEAWLKATSPTGAMVGLDADPAAVAHVTLRLASYGPRVRLYAANFAQLEELPAEITPGFTHILFDLGVGSHQLGDSARGFSFTSTGPLQMRYGVTGHLPPAKLEGLNRLEKQLGYLPDALDVIHGLTSEELAEVIRVYGEERYSWRIAQALGAVSDDVSTAAEFAAIIRAALPNHYERGRIHPATRTFQALRLAVNRELEVVAFALPHALDWLAREGKLAVISFHSLEDRIVKHFFRDKARVCVCPPTQPQCTCPRQAQVALLTKRPVRASRAEVANNPRATGAKLRVVKKL